MKCVLHIGTEKTGTTLLQDWLYDNQKELGRQGIFLSDMLGKTNNRFLSAYFQHALDDWAKVFGIETFEQKEAYFEGFLDKFRKEIHKAEQDHDVCVISSEHFHSRVTRREDIAALAAFLRGLFSKVVVICYFRNQFDMAVSFYSTALWVSPVSSELEKFVQSANPKDYYYNFLQIADNWVSAFGREACEFRIFDRERFLEGDLRKDFIRFVSDQADLERLDYKIASSNVALSALEGAAYRAVNQKIPFWDDENGRVSLLNQQAKQSFSEIDALKTARLQSSARLDVERIFDDNNTEFFEKYFACENIFISGGSKSQSEVTFTLREVQDIVYQSVSAALGFVEGETLRDADADWLRDLALRIDGNAKLRLEDSLALMQLAQIARPNGVYIAQKIEEYEARLAEAALEQ